MSEVKTYSYIPPPWPAYGVYYFTTDSGVKYEVRFNKGGENPFTCSMAFGAQNEEFYEDEKEEYIVVNRGELYRVMATVVVIFRDYLKEHPRMESFVFSGESTKKEDAQKVIITTRTKLFLRYIDKIFDDSWKTILEGNKIKVVRMRF